MGTKIKWSKILRSELRNLKGLKASLNIRDVDCFLSSEKQQQQQQQ